MSAASFELERFEWTAPDRLEVTGRWRGVRGIRFLRPTLDVEADGERRHLLAVLDHKPWSAEDGDEWVAAFPWRGEQVDPTGAELAVTPNVIVTLPAPGGSAEAGGVPREPAPAPDDRDRAVTLELREQLDAVAAERDVAVRQRDAALADAARAAKRDAARAGADDEARAAAEEAARERDAALAARDELAERLNAAVAAGHAAKADAESAATERDAAEARHRERERGARERDQAVRQRDQAILERDQAIRERDEARRERDELSARLRQAPAAAPSLGPAATPPGPARSTSPWLVRGLALGALALLLAIVAAISQGLL